MLHHEYTVKLASMFYQQDEEQGHYPERRLWCAVVLSAVDEYMEWILRISNGWRTSRRPLPTHYKYSLNYLRQQCRSEWFVMICEMAEFPAHKVLKKFDELDREFGISQIPFEPSEDNFPSHWELRKANRNKLAN